ncbi:MAG: hypothetical protein GX638_16290, partial [Crenarchaeota archaeon]|nr:hypothetical protein [Thermoproteota archaeon]
KLLIDRVHHYTNLLVLQSFPISRNESSIREICNYAVDNEMYIILNLGTYNSTTWPWQFQLFQDAKNIWGKYYLGAYYDDEPGGMQLDYDWDSFFNNENSVELFNWILENPNLILVDGPFAVKNSTHVSRISWYYAQIYAKLLDYQVNGTIPSNYDIETELFFYYYKQYSAFQMLTHVGVKTFTSDYSFYWFDYEAGYDVILAQLGWNSSYIKDIDFVRGAANMQNKEWGAILTWKYTQQPYLGSGAELYDQMQMAYQAGAKYIIIFNYPEIDGNPYWTMTDEHFEAVEQFSNDLMDTSNIRTIIDYSQADAVLVLPKNYAWGMRDIDDKVWGYWYPDQKASQIWNITCHLLLQYRLKLDIIYDDSEFPVGEKYQIVYYWNQTLK